MVNDKYLYLIQLCMELQRGEDGYIEKRKASGRPGPTAFTWFYGHTASLDIMIYLHGWDDRCNPCEHFEFNLSRIQYEEEDEESKKMFVECRDLLISLLREEGKDGVL